LLKKEDKIFLGVLAVVGVIAFVLLMHSYTQTSNEYTVAPMAIKEIPFNAIKVDDARASFTPYNGIIYGKNVSFLPANVNDENFFKIEQFDQIKFSINNKRDGTSVYQDEVVISIRGIKYSQLPIVYDYRRELSIWPAGLSRVSWYTGDGVSFTTTESAPWAVNTKVSKMGTGFAFVASVVLSFIIAYCVGIIAIIINRAGEYLSERKSAKANKT